MARLPGARRIDAQGVAPVSLLVSTHSTEARFGGICTASRFHEFLPRIVGGALMIAGLWLVAKF
jgi:hypothetical protein